MPLLLNYRSSLAAFGQTARFLFVDSTTGCVPRIIESRVFSSKAVPYGCVVHTADDDRSCRYAHFAGNEIDSLGSVHSN
jgi:hypothetical protein